MIGYLGPWSLWHRDKGGIDGTCGWFMRANHGDAKVLKAIESLYSLEWDRTCKLHNGSVSYVGLFDTTPAGWPAMSIHAIALNLFSWAAWEHFGHDRDERDKFMQKNLFNILLFAENPVDSACHGWKHSYGINEHETREDRIHAAAVMIYGWILRKDRRWYQHPRWHVHHWRLTFNGGYLKRRLGINPKKRNK
jgi:hypothetical protein